MSESSERTLNERIAILMGWTFRYVPAHFFRRGAEPMRARVREDGDWLWTGGDFTYAPDFEHSVDALKPVEEKLREAGWVLVVENGSRSRAYWIPTHGEQDDFYADTESRARALAAEAALIALSVEGGK